MRNPWRDPIHDPSPPRLRPSLDSGGARNARGAQRRREEGVQIWEKLDVLEGRERRSFSPTRVVAAVDDEGGALTGGSPTRAVAVVVMEARGEKIEESFC